MLLFSLFPLLIAGTLSCQQERTAATAPAAPDSNETFSARNGDGKFRVETVVSNLEVPWSILFTPDGRMLFTERPGRVRVVEKGKLRPQPLAHIREARATSESGLMGMTLHPNYKTNRWVYLAYTHGRRGNSVVRVERYRDTGDALVEPKTIIDRIPAAPNHAGTRLKFGPDGKLYVTTGDASDREIAQQLDSLGGKTLRLNDDGTAPRDNPFTNRPGARPEIWSYGHRNAQGLDWQPGTNLMFQTEHGPSGFDGPGGGDEVNIVEKGKNYGWPVIHHEQTRPGMVAPLLEYTPAVAPASGMFYRGSRLPAFTNNYFFGNLRGRSIIRVVLNGRKVVRQEKLLDRQYGRIREMAEGPDGAIYFSTSNRDGRGDPASNDDRIMRLVPAK
ncbi:MAG: PQQ-dependent sugar dehydrogenase [Armatimonadetes bacterium]|nr:PQQ-dependent sugar dehydrogenase [Armatimonadota bacterium]